MTSYKTGDIILVPYPFEEHAGGRLRQALVVSPPEGTKATGELVMAQISSRLSAPPRLSDYRIRDWKQANMPRAAIVRSRLVSLQSVLVLRKLGECTAPDLQTSMAILTLALGWSDRPAC